MKKLAFSLYLAASPTLASGLSQLILETSFDAALVIDWRQSLSIKGFCAGRTGCTVHEVNPIINRLEGSGAGEGAGEGGASESAGEKGSYSDRRSVDTRLAAYFLTAGLAHGTISYMLPPERRVWWQWSTLLLEGACVAHNRKLGLHFSF